MSEIKVALFDLDGVINSAIPFSTRYSKMKNIDIETMLPFFNGIFQDCLVDKADLKEELQIVLEKWQWDGTVDELLTYWFEGEVNVDERFIKKIGFLKRNGITVVGGTNQEKYRTNYLRDVLDLDNLFAKFYSSAEIHIKKPSTKFFEYIINDLNISPNEMVYWDDSSEHVKSASELGINAYHFTEYERFEQEFKKHFEF
jgi:HAD superfamily hydrolase (TIGR01509 family)